MNRNVALTIDKLPRIHGDYVRNDEDWQSWDILQLCAASKSWTRSNPVGPIHLNHHSCLNLTVNSFGHSTRNNKESSPMLACNMRRLVMKVLIAHTWLLLVGGRKFWWRKTWFNCTEHQTAECVNKMSCELCSRHHTSVCNDQHLKGKSVMSSLGDDKVVYPVVVVKVGGIECLALLDFGAFSCLASAKLLHLLGFSRQRSNPRRLKCLWLLLQREWRSSRPLFYQGLGTTAWMPVLLKSIRRSFSAWKIPEMNS